MDHVGIVVRDIDETVARAGETVDGRAVGGRFVSADIDLQVLLCGESTLELIEVRAAGTLPQGEVQRKLLIAEGVPMRGERVDLDKALTPREL